LGNKILEINENELQISSSRDPLPTVEIDIDSIPENYHGYGDLVVNALAAAASELPKLRATIYVYQGMSINFHQQTQSAFFGVAGNKNLLNVLLSAFKSARVLNVRFSDSIDPSTATKDFHVQDGHVWRPLEPGIWYTELQDEKNVTEDAIMVPNEVENTELENDDTYRDSTPSRYRVARADASVGAIRNTIEQIFGLPEGSVALCDPKGSPLRSDAKIKTLRKRWGD
jgi:hypothetical protein